MAGEFSPQVKAAIAEREAYCCGSCGRGVAFVGSWVHQHRRARGMGGSKLDDTGTVVNGILQCGPCNIYVEAHPSWSLAMGYRVPQGADPATVPVWTARNGWVLLQGDGTYLGCDDPHPDETAVLEAASRVFLERTT